tara:strand:+ start:428 stop:637 length:210 start_codon:yes stop_codon:yes gene_type:complete
VKFERNQQMTIREQVETIERELITIVLIAKITEDKSLEKQAEIMNLEDKLEALYEEARMIRQDLPITYN